MFKYLLAFIGMIVLYNAGAQTASVQDCLGAIPVCQQIYEETLAPVGIGETEDFQAFNNCTVGESNSIWYTFTVDNSGQFGFVITPNNLNQDYDWILFDITNIRCEDLLEEVSAIVSCNASGGGNCDGLTGATGANVYDEQGPGCDNFPPDMNNGYTPFNNYVDVEAGNTYALCVINFSSISSQGYTLDFGLSEDIGIFDNTPPVLEYAAPASACQGDTLHLRFSEYIQCASISAENVELNGPQSPYAVTLLSGSCDEGGNYSKEFSLVVTPAIAAGEAVELSLVINNPGEVLDLCDNPAGPAVFSFETLAPPPPLELGQDTSLCSGQSLLLETVIEGTYTWSNGSSDPSIEITEGGIYWLEISTSCGTTRDTILVDFAETLPVLSLNADTTLCITDTLILDLSQEGTTHIWADGFTGSVRTILEAGSYRISARNGCGETQDSIQVEFVTPISSTLNDTTLCTGDTLSIMLNDQGASYTWQDGSTVGTYTITASGEYAVTIENACGSVDLTTAVDLITAPPSTLSLGPDTTLCSGEQWVISLAIPGVQYLWQDGITTNFYEVNAPGEYIVQAFNSCGSVTASVTVAYTEQLTAELPSDTILCPGQSLTLDASDEYATAYLWDDGTTKPQLTVSEAGFYSVLLSNPCGEKILDVEVATCETCSVYVPNAFSPNNDGRNDRFKAYSNCPFLDFEMKVFDRWGGLVFETDNPETPWNGILGNDEMDGGIYVYFIQAAVLENNQERQIEKSGSISLIR